MVISRSLGRKRKARTNKRKMTKGGETSYSTAVKPKTGGRPWMRGGAEPYFWFGRSRAAAEKAEREKASI